MQIYITTNKLNGKKYIGKEKYNNPNYLGSGKKIKNAIKKYGKKNFIKEVLEECNSEEHMEEREKYWIQHYNATVSKDFYNLAEGGEGGNTRAGFTKEEKKKYYDKIINTRKQNPSNWRPSLELRKKWSETRKGKPNKYKGVSKKELFGESYVAPNKGKSILEEYKKDIINLYINKDYSLKEIAVKYKCFSGTVRRFLVNNNVKIDLHKGLARGRKTLIANSIEARLKDQIISDFKNGMTIPEINKKYNIKSTDRVLRLNNIKRYPNRYPETHRPVSIKNKEGFIKHFKSLKECAIFIGASIGEVSCLANNRKFQLRGWTTLDRDHTKIKIPDRLIVDPYGKIWNIAIEAKDIKTFCKKHNLKVGSISRVLNKKTLQHKGWHLPNTQIPLKNQLKKIIKDNVIIEFVSFTQLVNNIKYKQYNFRKDSLCNLFKGIITNHRGWTVFKD